MINVAELAGIPDNTNPSSYGEIPMYDILNYIDSDEFFIELIKRIELPSKARLAREKLRLKRLSGQSRDKIEGNVEVQKVIMQLKDGIEEGGSTEGLLPQSVQPSVLVYVPNAGKAGEIMAYNEPYLGSEQVKAYKETELMEKEINNIVVVINRKKLISYPELTVIKEARNKYAEDKEHLKEILNILNKEIANRTKKYHKDLISYLKKVEGSVEISKAEGINQRNVQAKLDRNLKAIILDELNTKSDEIFSEYLDGKLEYQQYLERKEKLFKDYNLLWPE